MFEVPPYFCRLQCKDKILEKWSKQNENHEFTKKYSMVLPPPNVTGVLHMGHALCFLLQDVFARYYRAREYSVMWCPGSDHAGIATQSVVEKFLAEQGHDIKNIPKQDLINHIWDWKHLREKYIIEQIKSIGCSCTWDRYRFTMDAQYCASVRYAFKVLFDKGLIYKGKYMINWDPLYQTAISDDELEYEEVDSTLYYFKYKLTGFDECLTVATTRPETILGDEAVAVNPEDERYKSLVNSKVKNPFTDKLLPIICDTAVSIDFGTGVLKVTPAHDKLDYEIGTRHNLPITPVIDKAGIVLPGFKEFSGLGVLNAREKAISTLKAQGLFVKAEPIKSMVAISHRSKARVDTVVSEQWFVKVSSFKDRLLKILDHGDIVIFPKTFVSSYKVWISGLRDWCISRQIVWGHQIPIWTNKVTGEVVSFEGTDKEFRELHENEAEWKQETDVLDTWFSSALWPFAIFGWPEPKANLLKYYPLDVLVSGHDIIFFWITRMLMLGIELTNRIPFKNIVLHGLLYSRSYWTYDDAGKVVYIFGNRRDEYEKGKALENNVFSKWEKISKSKGNVIDPIDVCSKYGEDAMRLGLLSGSYLVPQIDISESRFAYGKSFVTKLWNAFRYNMINLAFCNEDLQVYSERKDMSSVEEETLASWVVLKYSKMKDKYEKSIDMHDITKALSFIEEFLWDSYCSVFIENAKFYSTNPRKKQECFGVSFAVMVALLVDLHPFAPFVTEEIHGIIRRDYKNVLRVFNQGNFTSFDIRRILASESCMASSAIAHIEVTDKIIHMSNMFDHIQFIVNEIRSIRGYMQVKPNDLSVFLKVKDPQVSFTHETLEQIRFVARVFVVKLVKEDSNFVGVCEIDSVIIGINVPETVALDRKPTVIKDIQNAKLKIHDIEKRLANQKFIENAPKTRYVLEKKMETLKGKLLTLSNILGSLNQAL